MAALIDARRLVVKIGSALLVDAITGALKEVWLASLAEDIAAIRARGTDVIVVSSGSIALGRGVLKLSGELSLDQSQAAAAVGQIRLARAWEAALAPHGLTTAQILVTLEDSANRRRYLNTRATLTQLLGLGVTPIVNENDTIATDEIRYGDNDRLAAQMAVTVGADCLVLLSDVDGFYDDNPGLNKGAKRFDIVDKITSEIEAMAGDAGTGLSKGGMKTKLMAARLATDAGCAMAIASGTIANPLARLENGAPATWFTAQLDPQAARKRWIAAMKPKGDLTIDGGAVRALIAGNSLLPAGVRAVSGRFERGDPVRMVGPDGPIGLGLSTYSASEAAVIAGKRSDSIVDILGYKGRSTLIHRDDMVVQD